MSEGVAIIKVNGIDVGSMPLEQYHAIVKKVKKDWRNRIVSAFSVLHYLFRIASVYCEYFIKTLVIFMALFFISSITSPSSVTELISSLKYSTPTDITTLIHTITNFAILISIFSFIMMLFFMPHTRFNYISPFDVAINKIIRTIMEVPANGDVTVSIENNGCIIDVR